MADEDRYRRWQDDRESYRQRDYRGRPDFRDDDDPRLRGGYDRGGDYGPGRDYPSEERGGGRRGYGPMFGGPAPGGPMFGAMGGYGTEGYRGGRGYGQDQGEHYRGDRSFFERAGDEVATWFGSDDAERRRREDARQGDQGADHHRGKGPSGYTRSDDRINEDAHDRLTDDPYLDASSITVRVSAGEVTLDGTVNSRSDKRRAEDIVDGISGVKHVQNNLRVQPGSATGERATVL
ncbi:BON domain-containing protein [Geminicoccus roseus]|uniref:BON domain-containing protein n=1 Tax=Geminicoccus roseus TaxID=404900 RepID=UPI0003F6F303|nr:BON domain-containing protein [Geminicoccus roseus]